MKKVNFNILEFNQAWEKTIIGSVCVYIQRGKGPKYADKKNDYPVLNQKCIRPEGILYENIKYVTEEFWKENDDIRFVKKNDILWNSTGTGTIGRLVIYDDYKFKKILADGHLTILRVAEDYNPKFLFYFLCSPYVQTEIEIIFSGSTDQVELTLPAIENTIVPKINKSLQDKIVEKIDNFYLNFYSLQTSLEKISNIKIKGKILDLEKKFLLDVFK